LSGRAGDRRALVCAVALLAGGYLLYGLLSGNLGQFAHLPDPDRARILSNIHAASTAMTFGLAIGTVGATIVLWGEEYTGYGVVGATTLIGIGVPYLLGAFAAKADNYALQQAQAAFPHAMPIPLVVGGLLIAYDIAQRLIRVFQDRPVATERMTFGQEADAKAVSELPRRTSILGKCWEGPYCRDFIRPRCPIFLSRKACWKVKQGCYCEADIVSSAAEHISGIRLEMAPDALHNFANAPGGAMPDTKTKIAFDPLAPDQVHLGTIGTIGTLGTLERTGAPVTAALSARRPERKVELTAGQKRERCRNCVIYNEHQREKYRVTMPATIVAALAFCAVMNVPLRAFLSTCLRTVDSLVNQASFTGHDRPLVIVGQVSDSVIWCLFAALALIVVTKALQTLEWAIFKVKV